MRVIVSERGWRMISRLIKAMAPQPMARTKYDPGLSAHVCDTHEDRVERALYRILVTTESLMSRVDDLNNAVAGIATAFSALDAAIKVELKQLADAVAAAGDPALIAAVDAATANITSLTGQVTADTQALMADDPPAPAAPA